MVHCSAMSSPAVQSAHLHNLLAFEGMNLAWGEKQGEEEEEEEEEDEEDEEEEEIDGKSARG